MHPAENRGLRELYVTGRQLRQHWRKLADRLEASGAAAPVPQLRDGSDAARAMLSELTDVTAARGLWGKPAAQGFGAQIAAARNTLLDPSLEVNQALRLALLDVQHVATLLAYLERLARQRGDEELRDFLAGWGERMRDHEDTIRAATIGVGEMPAEAIARSTPGVIGCVAHGVVNTIGTVGEWFDRRSAR